MFLDHERSWPIKGGASDIYIPFLNNHLTNRKIYNIFIYE